jgi:hypothetical protein
MTFSAGVIKIQEIVRETEFLYLLANQRKKLTLWKTKILIGWWNRESLLKMKIKIIYEKRISIISSEKSPTELEQSPKIN